MTDSEKLLLLADWFDSKQNQGVWPKSMSREVQKDLRRIAGRLAHIDVDLQMADQDSTPRR